MSELSELAGFTEAGDPMSDVFKASQLNKLSSLRQVGPLLHLRQPTLSNWLTEGESEIEVRDQKNPWVRLFGCYQPVRGELKMKAADADWMEKNARSRQAEKKDRCTKIDGEMGIIYRQIDR